MVARKRTKKAETPAAETIIEAPDSPVADGAAGIVASVAASVAANIRGAYLPVWLCAALCLSACLLYTSPSPRDRQKSRMPSSA